MYQIDLISQTNVLLRQSHPGWRGSMIFGLLSVDLEMSQDPFPADTLCRPVYPAVGCALKNGNI